MPTRRGLWWGVGLGVVVVGIVYLHERSVKAKQNAYPNGYPGDIANLVSGIDNQGNFFVSQTINPMLTVNPNDLMYSSALTSENPYQNSMYLQALAQEQTIGNQLSEITSGQPVQAATPFPPPLATAPNEPGQVNYPYPVGIPALPGGPYTFQSGFFNYPVGGSPNVNPGGPINLVNTTL